VDPTRFHFLDQMQLWFSCNEKPEPTGSQTVDNVVLLSEAFYLESREHPIPVERDVIAALAHAPGLLDFYVWIACTSWTVSGHPPSLVCLPLSCALREPARHLISVSCAPLAGSVGQEEPFNHGCQQMKVLAGLEVTAKAVERTAEAVGTDIAQREQEEIPTSLAV